MLDGLEDAYDNRCPMGYFAEQCVSQFKFTREEQDAFSIESLKRARHAEESGQFKQEIIPLTVKSKIGDILVEKDEKPFSVNPEKIPQLKAAFMKDGTVTAGNASSIADGAAALTIMSAGEAEKRGIKPVARIAGHATYAKKPAEFTTAPIDATRKLLQQVGWKIDEIDLFEVNEAFAVVAMAYMRELNIPHDKLNVHGGACALGHPIGASGARIIVTLLAAMQERNAKRGIATLCIGGGEATAVAIELI
jgi:acetyl-CoA C-acetyltransferase